MPMCSTRGNTADKISQICTNELCPFYAVVVIAHSHLFKPLKYLMNSLTTTFIIFLEFNQHI